MPDTIEGQEKKSPSKKESYDEVVTVKRWDGKKFTRSIDSVPMYRKTDKDGEVRMWTWNGVLESNPSKGTEITDKDGVVWVVKKVTNGSQFHVSTVEKKPEEKKP